MRIALKIGDNSPVYILEDLSILIYSSPMK